MDLEDNLLYELNEVEIIDSHEHLEPENEAVKIERDIFSFFSGYTQFDLISSGLKMQELEKLFTKSISLYERWQILEPYWQNIKNTCYSQSLIIALKEIYGFDEIKESNFTQISEIIKKSFKTGIYKTILNDKCNIKKALTQCFRTDVDKDIDPLLLPIMPLWIGAGSTTRKWEDFYDLGPMTSIVPSIDVYLPEWKYKIKKINTLEDCIENQIYYYKKIKEEGA